MTLENQVILVTGASKGIGQAIARHLGQNRASVAIHYNQGQKEAEALAKEIANGAKAFQANLENNDQIVSLFDEIKNEYGKVNGLVNNAGIAIATDINTDYQEWMNDWQRTVQVNLNAPALLCKLAINHFLEQQGGRIVNISSRAAFRGDTPEYMDYAASKGGLVALTRSIARGYGKQGIIAFNVAPGFTRTAMAQDFIDKYGEDYAINDIALNQLTRPEDIAPMVSFLLSGQADHATGGSFDINAGSYIH